MRDLASVPRRLTLAVLLAGAFTVSFTITLLVVSLPRVAADLDSTVSVMSWTIIAPMLSFGVVGPAFGKAGDLWGHKRMFVGGLVLAGTFSVASGFAWNAASLIALRTLAAGAGSATGPAAMAYINRMFDGHERVRPLGYWSFVTAGAPVFGVVAGAPLVEAVGWRAIFLVQGPLCVVGAVLAARMLVDTERQRDVRFDVAGSALLGLGSVLVLVAINRGNAWGWGSPTIVGCATGGVAALWAFVRTERRVAEPLLPLHWLRTRNVAVPLAVSGLMTLTYMGSFLVVPQMLQEGLGYSASEVGWITIARPLAFALSAPLAGAVALRIGQRRAGMLGGGLMASATILLMAIAGPGPDVVLAVTGLALAGAGSGVAVPSLTALIAGSVESSDLGVAGALRQLASEMGGVLGGALMFAVHESAMGLGTVPSYSAGLAVGLAAALLATGAASQLRGAPVRT